jgi:hypothetical protein
MATLSMDKEHRQLSQIAVIILGQISIVQVNSTQHPKKIINLTKANNKKRSVLSPELVSLQRKQLLNY